MSINERIRHLRKHVLHLNQTDFAKKLGMTQTGVSYLEHQGATITEQTIRTICLVFGVREEWLRHGEEPMDCPSDIEKLEHLVTIGAISDLELKILQAYFSLEPCLRQQLLRHFQAYLLPPSKSSAKQDGNTASPQEQPREDTTPVHTLLISKHTLS